MAFITLEKEHLGVSKPSYLVGLLWVNESLPSTSRACNDSSAAAAGFSSHSVVQLLGLYKPTFFIYSAFEII